MRKRWFAFRQLIDDDEKRHKSKRSPRQKIDKLVSTTTMTRRRGCVWLVRKGVREDQRAETQICKLFLYRRHVKYERHWSERRRENTDEDDDDDGHRRDGMHKRFFYIYCFNKFFLSKHLAFQINLHDLNGREMFVVKDNKVDCFCSTISQRLKSETENSQSETV